MNFEDFAAQFDQPNFRIVELEDLVFVDAGGEEFVAEKDDIVSSLPEDVEDFDYSEFCSDLTTVWDSSEDEADESVHAILFAAGHGDAIFAKPSDEALEELQEEAESKEEFALIGQCVMALKGNENAIDACREVLVAACAQEV